MSESSDANAAPEWLATETLTNPVARLLGVLERMCDRDQQGGTVAVVWANTFGLNVSEVPYLAIAQTLGLVAEARAAVEAHIEDDDKKLYVDPFDHLSGVLGSMIMDHNPQVLLDGIRASMMSLRFCAKMVDIADERRRVDTDLVAELWDMVNELMDTVLASELPEPLRSVLYERIQAVRQAIEDFQLVGLDGLEVSLDGMVGALIRGREDLKGSKVREGLKAVFELGQRILVSAGKAKELAEPLFKLLGSGEG